MHRLLSLVLFAICSLPSCATIVDNGADHVPISTEPAGAVVIVKGATVGKTPTTIPVSRSGSAVLVRLELEGHHPQEVAVDTSFNGWFIGNIVFGGIIGIVVDLASGNAWHHDTTPVHVTLTPASQPSPGLRWQRPKPASRPSSRSAADDFYPL